MEVTQVLNGLPCIIYEELLIDPNDLINRSGIGRATIGIWDKEKRTFSDPNDLYDDEAMKSILEGTGITSLDLDQDHQAALENKMGNFDEADLQKSCAQLQGKDDETVTIANKSLQIGRKLCRQENTVSLPGLNTSPSKDPSIASGLTCDAEGRVLDA